MSDIDLEASLVGRWILVDVHYPPVDDDEDDGGFADEGEGSYHTAEQMGLAEAFLDFAADGTFTSMLYDELAGRWRMDGEAVTLEETGDEDESLELKGGLLERPEFDEEHGRPLVRRYAPESALSEMKFQAAVRAWWDGSARHGFPDVGALTALIDEGGASTGPCLADIAESAMSEFIEGQAWDTARLLLKHGWPVDEELLRCARSYGAPDDIVKMLQASDPG